METKCEVIGWLLDTDRAQVLIREENGDISVRTPSPGSAFDQHAIQTGRFDRADLIADSQEPLLLHPQLP